MKIIEKMNVKLFEGVRGMMIGTLTLCKSVLKTYLALLIILLTWPIEGINWISNRKRGYDC